MRKESILISPSAAATDHVYKVGQCRERATGDCSFLFPPFSSRSKGRRGLRISYSRTALSTKSKLYREAENGLQAGLGKTNMTKPGARHRVNLFYITLLLACRVQKFGIHEQLRQFVQ